MEEHIESLRKLEDVDLRIKEIRKGLEKYPNEINGLREELEQKKESVLLTETRLTELGVERQSLESSLQYNNDLIKKSEAKLFEIKTHKEYEALQREITQTKKENLEIEDRTISVMEEIEKTEKLLVEEKSSCSVLEEECGTKIAEKEKKIEELETSREPAEKEKSELVSKIASEILPVYERVLARNGRALALAEDEKCTSCNINIPPQLYNEILKCVKLVQCPSCRKILYVN